MNTSPHEKIDRVARYSRSLRLLFQVVFGVVVVAGFATVFLIFASHPTLQVAIGGFRILGENVGIAMRLLLLPGALFAIGIALKLLFHLIVLFGLYARRRIFAAENVGEIRGIGVTMLLAVPLWLYFLLLKQIALVGAFAGPESPFLSVELTPPFSSLITGAMIIIVSWIMDVGRELREEQDLTV